MQYFVTLVIFTPLALLAIEIMARRGLLRADSLAAGPPRDLGLTPFDLFFALALMFLGGNLAQTILPSPQAPGDKDLHRAVANFIGQLALLGLPGLYLLVRARLQPDGLRRLGVVPRHPLAELRAGATALVLVFPIVLAAISLSTIFAMGLGYPPPQTGHEILKELSETHSIRAAAMIVVSAAAVAPVLEELLFRGMLQTALVNTFRDRLRWPSLALAAAIFALCHLGAAPAPMLPGLFVLGLAFGWLYERTGSLLPGIAMHVGFNAVNIVLASS